MTYAVRHLHLVECTAVRKHVTVVLPGHNGWTKVCGVYIHLPCLFPVTFNVWIPPICPNLCYFENESYRKRRRCNWCGSLTKKPLLFSVFCFEYICDIFPANLWQSKFQGISKFFFSEIYHFIPGNSKVHPSNSSETFFTTMALIFHHSSGSRVVQLSPIIWYFKFQFWLRVLLSTIRRKLANSSELKAHGGFSL